MATTNVDIVDTVYGVLIQLILSLIHMWRMILKDPTQEEYLETCVASDLFADVPAYSSSCMLELHESMLLVNTS